MPTTIPDIQYTEENYTELYNSMPTGLKDLVLSGKLAILVSGIGVKNGLNPDLVSLLEPAVEDICLGLVTKEDLPKNISTQVGIDLTLAKKIADACLTEILNTYAQDIDFVRNYKLAMDDRITGRKKAKTDAANSVDSGSLRNQILQENQEKINYNQKISDFFTKNTSTININKTTTDNNNNNPNIIAKKENKFGASNYIGSDFLNSEPSTANTKPNNAVSFANIINKNTSNNSTTNDSKGITKMEQELATLTQSINALVKSTPTAHNLNLKSIEDLNRRIDKLDNEIKKINEKQIDLQNQLKKIDTQLLITNSNQNNKDKTESTKITDATPVIENNTKENTEKQKDITVFDSSITKNAFENLFDKKESTLTDSDKTIFSPTAFSWGNKAVDFDKMTESKTEENKNYIENKEQNVVENKKILSNILLNDLEKLKSNVTSSTDATNLKKEINPTNKIDKIHDLQQKIKALNQANI